MIRLQFSTVKIFTFKCNNKLAKKLNHIYISQHIKNSVQLWSAIQ